MIGSLSSSPDISDLETQKPGKQINDEVIRTVLGIKYGELEQSRQAHLKIFDPSYLTAVIQEKPRPVKPLKPEITHTIL